MIKQNLLIKNLVSFGRVLISISVTMAASFPQIRLTPAQYSLKFFSKKFK